MAAGGSNTGPFEGYDFRNAYAPGVSQDGTGQSVGLFELFGFSAQDIQDYEDEVGIYPYVNVQPVLIDGASGDDSSVDWITYPGYLDYSFEVTGDIEMAISMAPGLSSVLVYEGPTPQDVPPLGTNYIQDAVTTAQINDVLNRMATDDLAKQLSCSYGFDINLSTVQIFQQYAAQGQSFFLASGDAGAFSAAVDEPADDPYITVVGGTTLTMTSAGAWASETAWLTPASNDPLLGYTPEAGNRRRSQPRLWHSDLATGHQHDGQPRLHHHAQRAGRLHGGQQPEYRVGQRFSSERHLTSRRRAPAWPPPSGRV